MSAIDDVLKYVATNEIRWIDLQFFDVKGKLHRVSISNRKLEEASFGNGIYAADLSEVFGQSSQGDLVLLPDPETLSRLPWETSSVRLICDVVTAGNKERFLKDPRYMAQRIETNLNAAGIKSALVGSEIDCYMFDGATVDKNTRARGMGVLMDSRESQWSPSALSANQTHGAFAATPYDVMYAARNQVSETLEDHFGMMVDSHRHGRSPTAQQTFELAERSLKSAADATNTLKLVAKNLAATVGASASFMPYPIEGEKGNSLNVSMSLWKTADSNLFYEGKEEYGQLSQSGRYFIGGVLEHSSAIMAFAAPTPNSYRKLTADPKKFGWSAADSGSLLFVPSAKKNVKEVKRVVFKASDPSANPYLLYAALVSAGLDGIKSKTEPGDQTEKDSKKRVEKSLPSSLMESLSALSSDMKFIKGTFPTELLDDYVEIKTKQHKESLMGVTNLELHKYFNV
ncbi:glutamine synthetase beta-grasp domain-containing protein [Candidatus Micrarchaeota archaeon]|nr:glutamine synthetase beta-grasp domain-containing protein [Candidatus Micrarchaeota archaeon]